MEQIWFPWERTAEILQMALKEKTVSIGEDRKSFFVQDDEGNLERRFTVPWVQRIQDEKTADEYLKNLPYDLGDHLVLLIQAGAASMGIFKNGEIFSHKAITKYMVRKKQGKAQSTYSKQTAKLRAGSRIRLRNTVEFFVEINEKLLEWKKEIEGCRRLWYSCPVRLWTELFIANPPPPIERDDGRWTKIPLSVRTPNFNELKHIFYRLTHGDRKSVV